RESPSCHRPPQRSGRQVPPGTHPAPLHAASPVSRRSAGEAALGAPCSTPHIGFRGSVRGRNYTRQPLEDSPRLCGLLLPLPALPVPDPPTVRLPALEPPD